MRLGIDFDNTIVCYDALFHRVALDHGWIPAELPTHKSEVRNHLRRIGREPVWTELQGMVYGARMREAAPFPGVMDFLKQCRHAAITVFIISHKTKHPIVGPPHDLHRAALDWLEHQGFFDPQGAGLPRERVFFELTREAKLARIARCACTHFVDDLPEFLAEPGFPATTARFLFDPNHHYPEEKRFTRLTSWPDADNVLPVHPTQERPESIRDPRIARFLESAGVGEDAREEPIASGGNNRVFRVVRGDRAWVLKLYFMTAGDPRDRFRAERDFYDWIVRQGIRRTPKPLAWDAESRLGLFEFVEGRKLTPEEVTEGAVDQALALVRELNAARHSREASGIAPASEACFSIHDHLECVTRRLERLRQLEGTTPEDRAAADFIRDKLEPAWSRVSRRVRDLGGQDAATPLPAAQRCLSPSDFGFHNALLADDGQLRFFDFEYAGWDDPAKLICDFFCQPAVPVSLDHWDRVVSGVRAVVKENTGDLAMRAQLLLPVYRIKWCCILLNEFLRTERARRRFATGLEADGMHKSRQLRKAQELLKQCDEPPDGPLPF